MHLQHRGAAISHDRNAQGAGGGGIQLMYGRSLMTITASHPYNVGMEHVRFSPTRQTSLAPSGWVGAGGVGGGGTKHANFANGDFWDF